MLTIAVAKGYLFKETLKLFRQIGIKIDDPDELSRKLKVTDHTGRYNFLLLRPADVPVYVEYGAADLGITGKDVLHEGSFKVAELLDLKFGRCDLVLAALKGKYQKNTLTNDLRVATKFVNSTAEYFKHKGLEIELIKLYGSVEMAPPSGLADVIVDLSATGSTLKENGLEIIDVVYQSTARLIANSVRVKTKYEQIIALAQKLQKVVK